MSEHNGELHYDDLNDLEPAEVRFTYRGVRYVLTEASGDASVKWRAAVLRSIKPGEGGTATATEAMADTEPQLVAANLYFADDEGNLRLKDGKPDPKFLAGAAHVRALPGRLLRKLFTDCKRMSRLGEYEDSLDSLRKARDFISERIAELEAAGGSPKN